MIDPRALQQHFKNVNQRQPPSENIIPRVPDLRPLTGIESISVIQTVVDTSKLQEELKEATEALITLKQSLSEVSKFEPVTITVPVTVAVEQPVPVTSNTVINKQSEVVEEEDYNPYGYYSGPKF